MIVYPAIDIRGGRCVRLVEGNFEREVVFDEDPVDAARRWFDAGAAWLHVVDLDAAVVGEPVNIDAVVRIRSEVDIPIQIGGGMRLEEHLEAAFDHGFDRVILGTAAIHDADLVRRAISRWGDRIAVGLDARDGNLAAGGWLEQTESAAQDVARQLRHDGVTHFIVTDIRRDGTLQGPNLSVLGEMIALLGHGVIASGGIGSVEDISRVAATGADGVVVGRALYDGRVSLAEILSTLKSTDRGA